MSLPIVASQGDPDPTPPSVADRPEPTPDFVPPSPKQPLVWFSVGWLVLLCLVALAADWLPLGRIDVAVGESFERPGARWPEPLGTDRFGRSLLSRLVHGARVSLLVGTLGAGFGMLIGGLLGTIAGYLRGRVDSVINLLIDAALAFPALVLLLALAAVLNPSVPTLIITVGGITIPHFARLARANAIRVASREFVTAARLLGAGHRRILMREITANVAVPVASYAFLIMAVIIVAEGSLSFLGLGVPPPQPTWGGMIAQGRESLADHPHTVFVPSMALLLTVFSLNVVGDFARSRFDHSGAS